MALVHKYINRDMQSLYKMAGDNGGARTRSATGSKSIMNQLEQIAGMGQGREKT
jgi:hypothetical protein